MWRPLKYRKQDFHGENFGNIDDTTAFFWVGVLNEKLPVRLRQYFMTSSKLPSWFSWEKSWFSDQKHRPCTNELRMLEAESDADVVSEFLQQSWAYSEAVSYALGSHARSKELDSMIPTGPFQLEVFYQPGIIKRFTSSQILIKEDCFEAWWIF